MSNRHRPDADYNDATTARRCTCCHRNIFDDDISRVLAAARLLRGLRQRVSGILRAERVVVLPEYIILDFRVAPMA